MSRIIHFALTIGYALFFVIHIVQVILAGWNNFRAMVTGFEVIKFQEDPMLQPEPLPVPIEPEIPDVPQVITTEEKIEDEEIHE
jgi:hypothetical protein